MNHVSEIVGGREGDRHIRTIRGGRRTKGKFYSVMFVMRKLP